MEPPFLLSDKPPGGIIAVPCVFGRTLLVRLFTSTTLPYRIPGKAVNGVLAGYPGAPSPNIFSLTVSGRSRELLPVFTRRLAEDSLEYAVEVGQRLKTNLKSDLAHSQIRIQQQILGLRDAYWNLLVQGHSARAETRLVHEEKP